ncbi:MAG TPA: type II toxin-antitoxin system RelE/ParE family toxin [Acetobacteraceae bacterium]|nr:type II toxin-antitoxin system RelE/ParE family toxin [Acetobacteraceae bacterium]
MALLIPALVEKQLAAMPKADARRLRDRLQAIAAAPTAQHPNVLPLVGRPGAFRVRQGDWRAVFSIEQGDVLVDRIAHRREIYR